MMLQTAKIYWALGLFSVIGLGIQQSTATPAPQLYAQSSTPFFGTPQATTSFLTFQTDEPGAPLSQFQIPLKQAIADPVEDQTTLNATALGAIALQSSTGSAQRIDVYQWSIAPSSRLYLSPSGYKSLMAKYQYTEAGQTRILNIFCQSRALQDNKASCSFSGNGPLLKGEAKGIGTLNINQGPMANDSPAPVPNDPSPNDPSPVPNSGQGYPSNAYRRGYELGILDANLSLERSYIRHKTEYDVSAEAEFRKGYENAYDNMGNSIRPGARPNN